jgi:hypothetical protein
MKLRTVLTVLVFAGFAACANAPTTAVPERGAEVRSGLETRADSSATMEFVATDSTTTTEAERGGGALGGGS